MSTDNKQSLPAITLAAIGVVYGDIGTSPLYTLRECLSGQFGFGVERDAVFGFLSLIFWLLILVVSVKYLSFVMRADNAGEGGILTLMSLAGRNTSARMTSVLVIIGLIGGSFFYGEVVITPAISVLSAIEGLEIIAPQLDTWVVPLAIIVLTLLFVIQKHGTGLVGKLFAPIMLAWFLILAALGLRSIIANPEVLHALNPYWAVHFFLEYKVVSFVALGAVVLSITGVEALYADMGHFGKLPIRVAWFLVVLPSLVLNYFGQGALLLKNPEAIKNPFFLLAPDWALVPMLILATLVRAVLGPRFTDRIVAVNVISTLVIAELVLLSVWLREDFLVDVALVFALLSFLAVVVVSRLVAARRRKRPEREKTGGNAHDR